MAADRSSRIGNVLRVLGALLSSQHELKPDVYLRLNDLRFYSKEEGSVASISPTEAISASIESSPAKKRARETEEPIAPQASRCWVCEKNVEEKEESISCVDCHEACHTACAADTERGIGIYKCGRCKLSFDGLKCVRKVLKVNGEDVVTLGYDSLSPAARAAALASLHSESDCRICLLEMSDGDETYALPCGHVYHLECIRQCVMRRAMAHHCNVCTMPIDLKVHQDVLQRVKASTREKRVRGEELLKMIKSVEMLTEAGEM